MSLGVHWFRRDLRLVGNRGFADNFKTTKGNTIGAFFFDSKFLKRPDFSHDRFHFFIETLESLQNDLKKCGSDLYVFDIDPVKGIKKIIEELNPSYLTWNRDYEPFSINRDKSVESLLKKTKIEYQNFRDHLLIEPWELTKKNSKDTYQIFTPFSKRWMEIFKTKEIQDRINRDKESLSIYKSNKKIKFNVSLNYKHKDVLKKFKSENLKSINIEPNEKVGFKSAYKKLKDFDLNNYKNRDYPAENANSNLSIFFKNGSLTTSQAIAELNLKPFLKKQKPQDYFFNELIWREFYYHILYHHPEVEKEAFNNKYKNIKWKNSKAQFKKWKEGITGFPIVDAGMRELNQTGKMHNRVRMIVASFLVKDLHIDWRWGEKYFMERLLDGDLAANNGGWQWCASTGCDAQPYFRIFNPYSQSLKFDKEGEYIKKFIPELSDLEPKLLHKPIIGHSAYPEPIVDHKIQREEAIEMFKKAAK